MRHLFIFIFFVSALQAPAQKFPWQVTAVFSGPEFTADFTKPVEEWISERLEKFAGTKQERDFIIRTEYQLDRLLKSGLVLCGDELSAYASIVADSLLAPDTALRNKIRIYTLLSSQANAWTFDRGIILITSGLYARLNNEAELAFILAHEIAHYREKHALSTYIFQNCDDLAGCTAPVKFSKVNGYSRENELFADHEAFGLLKKRNYSLNVIPSVFDFLQYDYLPLEEKKFSKSFFEDGHLVIPRQYALGILNPIVRRDDSHDTSGTHPSMAKRRLMLRLQLASDTGGAKTELLPGGDHGYFKTMSRTARLSLCEQYLAEGSYLEAFYNAYTLLKNYPGDKLPEKYIGTALYGIAQIRASFSGGSSFSSYERVQGEMQQVYYFFGKMTAIESTVLALHWNWKAGADPSGESRARCDSLFSLLTGLHRMRISDFSTELPPPDKYPAEVAGDVRGEVQSPKSAYDFHKYALGGLLRDSAFVQRFRYYEKRNNDNSFVDLLLQHRPVNNVLVLSPVIRIYGDKGREYFAAEERWKQAWYASLAKDSSADMHFFLHDFFPDKKDINRHLGEKTLSTYWLMERQSIAATFFPPAWSSNGMQYRFKNGNSTGSPDYLLLTGIIYRTVFTTDDIITSDAREKMLAHPKVTCYAMLYDLHTGRLVLHESYSKKRKISRRQLDKWAEKIRGQISEL
ncbi:MAG: peptidase M48 Ste24p [Bacteroidetes bacterium]|nr:MAG: peptidase M48 Ste24p [Bacteroidota bacterium]